MAISTAVLLPIAGAQAQVPHTRSVATAASPAHKARVQTVKVSPRLFGVHDANLTSLSHHSTGSIRLWDTGVMWTDLQPDSTTMDFTRLDQIVNLAHQNGTEVTLVLGLTPKFAAPDPDSPTYATEMPKLALYQHYVTAVMQRYKNFFGKGQRGIANYQVWNEANISTFWTGTVAQMAQLTHTVWKIRNSVDPGARVIAPAQVTRLGYQQAWTKKFYAQKVGGKPVWKYVDALSLNLYPLATYPSGSHTRPGRPEDSMALLALERGILHKDGVPSKIPIWNTEVNYGLNAGPLGGTESTTIPDALQVAYLIRTYLLNAAAGVSRVDWYAYDMGRLPSGGTLGNTLLTDPANLAAGILTPAGRAFTRVQSWMAGTLVGTKTRPPCTKDKHGTYTCVVMYHKGMGRIYWNPTTSAKVTLVKSAKTRMDENGASTSVKGGKKLTVTYAPVLVRSSR
jgi:hypothetical protein